MKGIHIIVLLFVTLSSLAQKPKIAEKDIKKSIDNYLEESLELNKVSGAAVAVIKDGEIIYERYFGKASIEQNTDVNENSIFRLYSATKLITTVAVFQLVEKGQLSLDDKVSKYLLSLPEEWENVSVRNLLTHSSGLPDIVKFEDISYSLDENEKWARLYKKPTEFEAGDRYSYNQTNYCLLTKIIEKITGTSFEEYVLRNQFPDAKEDVIFSANASEFIAKRVVHHVYNFKTKEYERFNADHGKIHNSGSGLNITLKAFMDWNKRLDNNHLLKQKTKDIMWSAFEFKNKRDSFLHGWSQHTTNSIKSVGFSGGYMTAFRKFTDTGLTVIFLSNGYKYFHIEEKVTDHLAGMVAEELIDRKKWAEEELANAFFKQDYKEAIQNYYSLKSKNPELNFEFALLTTAFDLMNTDQLDYAIQLFEFNVEENPESFIAFDSLAEGYFSKGLFELSKRNYKKSLELNPENGNAKDMLLKMEK